MGKDIFNIDKNKLSYGRGYVYSLQYHLVWCTKYRKKVLKNGIDTECEEMLQNLAEEYKFQILAITFGLYSLFLSLGISNSIFPNWDFTVFLL